MGLQKIAEGTRKDARERRRGTTRFLFHDIGGKRGGEGAPRPCRLFVIVICITMDETRIMGSWDLPGEHDAKERKKEGRKEPSRHFVIRHASTRVEHKVHRG